MSPTVAGKLLELDSKDERFGIDADNRVISVEDGQCSVLLYNERRGFEDHSLFAFGSGQQGLLTALENLVKNDRYIKQVTCTPDGKGWVILFGNNEAVWSETIPAAFTNTILQLNKCNRNIHWVAFAPNGGWIIQAQYKYQACNPDETFNPTNIQPALPPSEPVSAHQDDGPLLKKRAQPSIFVQFSSKKVRISGLVADELEKDRIKKILRTVFVATDVDVTPLEILSGASGLPETFWPMFTKKAAEAFQLIRKGEANEGVMCYTGAEVNASTARLAQGEYFLMFADCTFKIIKPQ